ncbi:hypothetical protein WJX74_003385 [Apatococcus lobatus]|uniref:PDEase domain-containing protein n=1 Tax=Apatococcus lobatus TaxID=904363 RepID=A0AAW1R0C5_9CHLO
MYERLRISQGSLERYMDSIERAYSELPYHNLMHVRSVVEVAVSMWTEMGLGGLVAAANPNDSDLLALAFVVAAAVHDVGHKGLTNDFLIRSNHPYAITYNDVSPNESYHCATAFKLLLDHHNFLADMPPEGFFVFRQAVLALIMATDMSKHHNILSQLRSRDWAHLSGGDSIIVLQGALKCADLGHTFMPVEQHVAWSEKLQQELFFEGDLWKEHGWVPPSLMDRGSASDFASSQAGFFRYIVIPFIEALASAVPGVKALKEAAERNAVFWQQQHAPS